MLTDREHLVYHTEFHDHPDLIGLSMDNNLDAISELENRVWDYDCQPGQIEISEADYVIIATQLRVKVAEVCTANNIVNPFELLDTVTIEQSNIQDEIVFNQNVVD